MINKNIIFYIFIIILNVKLSQATVEQDLRVEINNKITNANTNNLISDLSSSKGIRIVSTDPYYCGHISYIDNQLEVSCDDLKLPQINIIIYSKN